MKTIIQFTIQKGDKYYTSSGSGWTSKLTYLKKAFNNFQTMFT